MPQCRQTLKFTSAINDSPDTRTAIDQVCNQLTQSIASPVDLLVAFVTPHHRNAIDLLNERLETALKPTTLLLATAQGVIGVREEIEDQPGVSVIAAGLPGVVQIPFVSNHDESSLDSLDSALDRAEKPKAIILLADPFSTPITKLLTQFAEKFPGAPVIGGMASGAQQPGSNRLVLNGRVLEEGAVGVILSGDFEIDCIVSQGCRPIGKPYVITKSQRHLVMELAGRKSLQVLEELASQLPQSDKELIQSHGLMVGRVVNEYKDRFGRGDFLIRGVMGVDQDTGCIAIADPHIRVGQTIQFHVRDKKTAAEDFALLLEAQKLNAPPDGALLFSCNGRGKHLFGCKSIDAKIVHDAIGLVPLAGFFAAGEIGPIGAENFVHGHTASLVLFRGKPEPPPEQPK